MTSRFILLALALPGCVFADLGPQHIESETFTVDVPVDGVQFDLPAGDVTFQAADVPLVQVTWTLHYRGDRPSPSAQVSDSTLFIDADCPTIARTCSVDIDVLVPANVWAAGTTGAGDIDVDGLTAGVELDSGAGDISMHDIVGFVGASTGAGDIEGNMLDSAEVWAETGAGDVDLEVVGAPTTVSADSGSGDIWLGVPAGPYAVETSTGAGDVDIDGITVDSSSAALLQADTGAGNVTIHGF